MSAITDHIGTSGDQLDEKSAEHVENADPFEKFAHGIKKEHAKFEEYINSLPSKDALIARCKYMIDDCRFSWGITKKGEGSKRL